MLVFGACRASQVCDRADQYVRKRLTRTNKYIRLLDCGWGWNFGVGTFRLERSGFALETEKMDRSLVWSNVIVLHWWRLDSNKYE